MREEDNMFELIGSTELWQWDTGRQIDCAGLQAGTKVQFAYSDTQTLSTAVKSVSGANVADVPNQMLLRSGALMVYAYVTEADGASYTKYAARLNVQARPKPDDYVYTPTEVQSWQTIRDEIGDLDDLTTTAKNNLVAAINEAAASGGGGGSSVTKDSIVTALGYTPESAENKTTDLSASSTAAEYPSANAVWNAIPHPEAKTDAMTQAVGKDADGKLWTAPGGGGGETWEKLVDASLAEAVDSVTYTFDNCKRIKALIAPALSSDESVNGWKQITINNVPYPSVNSAMRSYEGVCFRVDSEYPPYVRASVASKQQTSTHGINGGQHSAVLENIAPNGITEFGCKTAGLLKAGTKIEIWGVKS